ncbi:phosphatidylglycerophosphatase A [Marinobacterium sp. LSUCC0821]|jgi:phosphatidylglycerophosphatase A|uniref:phosphatidylglycerophosphatase A family protein n=1 Tax=Marinobacterium sp. LSUCC0821 TaxID=2668067 RepID=UPI001451FA46|nr:phosphatidylglycerophosphatase A [Marinobacterium sp. LSUCC0821]QJD72020.1 phosphatidylglycerophosphatase A [Marinobacterium sp. LSUCC0821]
MSKTPASIWRNPIHFLAFGLGSGAAPKAPGTFGTLAAIPLWLLFADLPILSYIALIVVASLVGIWLCGQTSKDLGVHDHGGIVWDEFVGLWITYIALPEGWVWVLFGFLLFRLFDIWKPWPIGWADSKVSGGLGIMLDDILAGFMALGVLQAVNYLLI